jgi:hypothetical protein
MSLIWTRMKSMSRSLMSGRYSFTFTKSSPMAIGA